MTYIKTEIPQPGIVELLFYKGPTGKALSNLPNSKEEYVEMGKRMAGTGYNYPPLFLRKWVIRSFQKKARSN